MIGGTLGVTGATSIGVPGWLLPVIPATENIAAFKTLSPSGNIAVLGASRTSDNHGAGSEGSQGGSFFTLNNNITQLQTGYGIYTEARRYSGAGITQGAEFATLNGGNVIPVTPYSFAIMGETVGLLLSAGRQDVPSMDNSVSAAIFVGNDGANYNEGIVFQNTSIVSGRVGAIALDLPMNYTIAWRNPTNGNISSFIEGNESAALDQIGLVFTNSSLIFQDITTSATPVIMSRNGAASVAITALGFPPTNSGTCAINTQLGGNTAGSFKANGACAGGTISFTFAETATNGWACDASDLTDTTKTIQETGYNTASVQFLATLTASDLVSFKCIGF